MEGRTESTPAVRAFARLSTGTKMLLILSLALLPLGLIALFASMESAKTNRLYRESEARGIALISARRIDGRIAADAGNLRAILLQSPRDEAECRRILDARPAAEVRASQLAIYLGGKLLCGDPNIADRAALPPRGRIGTEILLFEHERTVRVVVGGSSGTFGITELDPAELRHAVGTPDERLTYELTLTQGTARLPIAYSSGSGSPLDQLIVATAPVAGGQMALEMRMRMAPVTALEMLMVLLPLLMWIAAAITGWLVVERLLLYPLGQLQRSISGYRAGDGPLSLPRLTTPAQEIRTLGESFRKVTDDLAGHEAELEQGLARQTRLTREVHHRVKNNLQVVSSLINLHSRGVEDQAVAAAYASIQRRVDALAIVHRNHYAELEENLGVSLRALIGELAANLRAMAPPEASRMAITVNMIPAFVTQDVAVPVAFLITEIFELAAACAPHSTVGIGLSPTDRQERARLVIDAAGLDSDNCRNHPSTERFERILMGLTRQLRSPMHHEDGSGRYEIEIGIVPQQGGGDAA